MSRRRKGFFCAALFAALLYPAPSLAQDVKNAEAALMKAARDPNPAVRLNAAKALSGFRDKKSAQTLLGMLDDQDPRVSAEAGFGLSNTGPAGQLAVIRRIGSLSEKKAVKLIEMVGGEGKPGLDLVESVLEKGPNLVRLRVIATFGDVINQDRPELLENSLRDSDPLIRAAALKAVGRWRRSKAETKLAVQLLDDPNVQVRIQAIFTVSKDSNPPVRRIFALLHDHSKSIRTAALSALVVLPMPPETIALEAERLKDKDPLVARKMAYLIDLRLEEMAFTWYLQTQFDDAFQKTFQLADTKKLRESLYRLLERGDSPYAGRALGIMGDSRAFEPLASRTIRALPSLTPAQQRMNRAQPYIERGPEGPPFFSLAMSDGRRAAPLLLARLDENETEVIRALGKTGSPTAVMPLINKMKTDPNPWIADAVASIGDPRATPFFIQIITSPTTSQQSRGNLLWRLGVLGGPGAVETLMNILDDPSESMIHWQAAAGMEALSDRASIPALEEAVKERKGRSLQEAIAALKRLQKVGKS